MQEYALHTLDIVPEDNLMVCGLVHMALANVQFALDEKQKALDQYELAVPLHWAAGNRVAATNAIMDTVVLNEVLGK